MAWLLITMSMGRDGENSWITKVQETDPDLILLWLPGRRARWRRPRMTATSDDGDLG